MLREEMNGSASECLDILGETPAFVTNAEATGRDMAHDSVKKDHGKDCESFAAFPPWLLEEMALRVIRVDYYGRVAWSSIVGAKAKANRPLHGWVLIYRGHMRLLIPPKDFLTTMGEK